MTIFFTSDTHFSHRRIIELCNRPFDDVDHMDTEIVRRWNETVMPEDEVFHLGDVALGTIVESLSKVGRLNGHITLIPGNHDRVFSGEPERKRDRFLPAYEEVFDIVGPEVLMLPFHGELTLLSHFPYEGDSHGEDRWAEKRPADVGYTLIHGHTHRTDRVARSKNKSLMIHVGMDAWDYRPVSEFEIKEIMEEHS